MNNAEFEQLSEKLQAEYEEAKRAGEPHTGTYDAWATYRASLGIKQKLEERRIRREEARLAEEAKKPHTYSEIIKAIAGANRTIEKLKDKPVDMRKAKKLELEAEFDTLVKLRMFSEHLRGEWVAKELYKYLSSEEYTSVVDEVKTVTANLAEYSEMKTQWEEDNKDIIEAERLRTKREELLSADPEALRALGITLPPVQKVSRAGEAEVDPKLKELMEALRAIRPSATDAELEKMAKLM